MTLVNRTNVKNEAPEKSATNDVTRTKGGRPRSLERRRRLNAAKSIIGKGKRICKDNRRAEERAFNREHNAGPNMRGGILDPSRIETQTQISFKTRLPEQLQQWPSRPGLRGGT